MGERTDIRIPEPSEKTAWDAVAVHPLQSWAWGEFRRAMHADVTRLARFSGGKLTDAMQMTFHSIPATPWTVGYMPKGPVPTTEILDRLLLTAREKHAVSILIEPYATTGAPIPRHRALGPAHHPMFTRHTFVLDLTKSEDDLLAAMHPKTRYNIRVAARHGVRIAEDNSDHAFEAYLSLSEETTRRQGFYAHDRTYHETMWRTMRDAGIASLWTATFNNDILAAWVLFTWKGVLYYPYGASSRDHREVMAPTLLLWEIARNAKRNGAHAFDLWGALGPTPDPKDPWYGFHRFKEGFAPTLVTSVGSYDLVANRPAYALYRIADTVRWTILKAKAKARS